MTCDRVVVRQDMVSWQSTEGSSPAAPPVARVGNNSDSKQDRQSFVIVFTVFCTLP